MKATALLLNWKRPENLNEIIHRLRRQTAAVDIFLWNNNPDDTTDYPVDLQINSGENLFCWPRWLMASFTDSDYVFSMDDDFCFEFDFVAAQCIEYMERYTDIDIIGYCGVRLNPRIDYWSSDHYKRPFEHEDIMVDIIKGRFLFARTQVLQHASSLHPFERGDDIAVSAAGSVKVLPAFLYGVMENLPAGDVGLDKGSSHRKLRKKVTHHYFNEDNLI